MRTVTYRFDDPRSFLTTLREGDLELPLPFGARVGDGEWVLVAFEVEGTGETSTPARGLHLDEDEMVLAFEPRDWERLLAFAEGRPPVLAAPPSGRVFEAGPISSGPPSSLPGGSPASSPLSGAVLPFSQGPVTQGLVTQAPVSQGSVSQGPVSQGPVAQAALSQGSLSPAAASVPVPFASKPSIGSFRAATRFAADEHAHARVLLVDDDDDIRDVVGAMLEAVGLTVDAVESAEAALDRLDHEPFDMAVLDWSLPGMTGLDLCKRIRAHEALAQLPILFLTAHSGSQDVVDAFASGADDYVVKPFRAPELGARIFSLLRRARFAGARVSS